MAETKDQILEYITNAKENKLSLFKKDVKLLLQHYNSELETSKSYHGRQLLELIQNADDQHASDILIVLDEEKGTISVSNNGGIPFSKAGYDSLFYANLSSKRGEEFIGHKGLGLRSILMWGEEFKIISNDIELTFSHKIANKEMKKMLANADFNESFRQVNNTYNIKGCPLSVFSCPKIEEYPTIDIAEGYTTTIYVAYKKDGSTLENIKNQISELNSEILLFLPHLKSIRFQGVDKNDIVCDTKSYRVKQITEGIRLTNIKINGAKWQIYEKTGELRTTKGNKYQVKLAMSDGECIESCLYSFFPTKISLKAPFILHGTFELDPTRNGLNESMGNEEVAMYLAQLIIAVAKHITTLKRKADSLPLRMLLSGLQTNISLKKVKFTQWIQDALYNEAVYPCIDNTYRRITKVTYVSDEFSKLIQDLESERIFPSMLQPGILCLLTGDVKSKLASVTNIEQLIYKINLDGFSISKRADLIYQLVKHFPDRKFNLLLDSESRRVAKDTVLFSPIDKKIDIPSFCRIRIINKDLYNELIQRFDINANPARELARKLSRSFNFKAYEPAPLVAKIISECNEKTLQKQSDTYIKETVTALYKNFCNEIITEVTSNTVLLLPTQSGRYETASNLYLSKDYPTGRIAFDIFGHLRSENDYIAPYAFFQVEAIGDIARFEAFLNWLGVNSFVRYKVIRQYNEIIGQYLGYYNYITNINVQTIEEIDKILRSISIEQIMLWIHVDKVLKKSLSDKHEDKLTRMRYNKDQDERKDDSLIKTIFIEHGFDFSSFILDESLQWANDIKIDYASPILVKYSISRRVLEGYLTLLNAKDTLDALSTERIVEILTSMTNNPFFKDGRNSQTTYVRILNILKDRPDVKDFMPKEYYVFASIGKEIIVCLNTECYFSERIDLPNQLRASYPIFNFPRRSGGAKAIEIFKINDLSSIEINISKSIISQYNDEFKEKFSRFKPLLLSVRLNNIRSEDSYRKNEKDVLEQLDIRLCSDLQFKDKEREGTLDDYSYILSDGTYFIKVCDDNYKRDKDQDRFNSCVAGILSSAFRISEDAPFELILSKSISDAEEWVKNKYGEDILSEAYRRFDRLDSKLEFCKCIKQLLHIPFTEDTLLDDIIFDNNRYDLSKRLSDYDNLSNEKNIVDLQMLFSELGITISAFNAVSSREINLASYHRENIRKMFIQKENSFKTALWKALSKKDPKFKMAFLDEIHSYSNSYKSIDVDVNCFKVDYKTVWQEFVSQYVDFKEDDIKCTWEGIEKIYSSNANTLKSLGYEINDLNINERSLLYFNTDAIDHLFKNRNEENNSPITSENDINQEDEPLINVVDSSFKSVYYSEESKPIEREKPIKVKSSKAYRDKMIGDSAEKRVYEVLQDRYGKDNVIWKSQEDDGAHYDISYMPSPDVCKYVEVKSFMRGRFDISKEEFAFGKEHPADYEIWLVDEEGAHPIKDFFDENGNSNYYLNPSSYEVILKKTDK